MTKTAESTAFLFALLAAISAVLGAYVKDLGIEAREPPGLTMLLTGLWFSMAIAAGLAALGHASIKSLATACVLVMLGWQVAFNLAFLVVYNADLYNARPGDGVAEMIGGFLAGAVGAVFTWAAVAFSEIRLRSFRAALNVALAGAFLGLFLPMAMWPDRLALLFLPWQVGVAGLLGFSAAQVRTDVSSAASP